MGAKPPSSPPLRGFKGAQTFCGGKKGLLPFLGAKPLILSCNAVKELAYFDTNMRLVG